MIILNDRIKSDILTLFNKVSRDIEESKKFLNLLEHRLIDADDERLFLEFRYIIFENNNPQYVKLLFKVFHTIYREIAKLNRDNDSSQFLDILFLDFYDNVFLKKCIEMTKRKDRNEVIHKVLRHLSKHQEKVLHTNQLMIANISHEMRTALSAIDGYGKIIEENKFLDKDSKDYLKKIQQSTKTLTALVNDVLSISKLNSGQMEIEIEPFWVDEMMLQAISDVSEKAKSKGLELSYDIPMLSSAYYGDRHRIYEIVVNLLSNAIKYTPKGFVHISLKTLKDNSKYEVLYFDVKDSGLGISKDQQNSIFDPYKRYNNTEEGVGLGLYLSSQLAQNMGGKIELESTIGEGSIFSFQIRLKKNYCSKKPLDNLNIFLLQEYQTKSSDDAVKIKVDTLKQLGAEVSCYSNGRNFSNNLFAKREDRENYPDIVTIVTDNSDYFAYNELIGYIKHFKGYDSSTFIAERTLNNKLNYFNMVTKYEIPVSYYIDIANEKRKNDTLKKSNQNSIRVLAVDDIATNLELLKLFIKKEYPKVKLDLALCAKDALEYFKKEQYNLLLLDLKMPDIDGFMLYEKLKNIKELPVTYALTADAYKETHQRVEETGFDGILTKPLNIEKLYKLIKEVDR